MTITYLDLYNKVTGQAWSMFDSEVEDSEEFETAVTTSIQKALGELYCSYNFPFRSKTYTFETSNEENGFELPNGLIEKHSVKGKEYYGVKLDGSLLKYNPDCVFMDDEIGKPTSFYLKGDKIILYPSPDDVYEVSVDYVSIYPVKDAEDEEKSTFENDDDYIDIPEKYETYFLDALMPLTMTYAIASLTDENYEGYKQQYEAAYKILLDVVRGIDTDKRIIY